MLRSGHCHMIFEATISATMLYRLQRGHQRSFSRHDAFTHISMLTFVQIANRHLDLRYNVVVLLFETELAKDVCRIWKQNIGRDQLTHDTKAVGDAKKCCNHCAYTSCTAMQMFGCRLLTTADYKFVMKSVYMPGWTRSGFSNGNSAGANS